MPLAKAWIPFDAAAVAELPGNLGVYEIGDDDGAVLYIGYAGGRSLFGLRSAIADVFAGAEGNSALRGRAGRFRYEVNQMYQTRWRELLAQHLAACGHLPEGNAAADESLPRLGRIG